MRSHHTARLATTSSKDRTGYGESDLQHLGVGRRLRRGPGPVRGDPIGVGGMRLHEWHFHPQGDDQRVIERLFDGVGELRLEPIQVLGSPAATHVKYRLA